MNRAFYMSTGQIRGDTEGHAGHNANAVPARPNVLRCLERRDIVLTTMRRNAAEASAQIRRLTWPIQEGVRRRKMRDD
jgi:hypothetical protein